MHNQNWITKFLNVFEFGRKNRFSQGILKDTSFDFGHFGLNFDLRLLVQTKVYGREAPFFDKNEPKMKFESYFGSRSIDFDWFTVIQQLHKTGSDTLKMDHDPSFVPKKPCSQEFHCVMEWEFRSKRGFSNA